MSDFEDKVEELVEELKQKRLKDLRVRQECETLRKTDQEKAFKRQKLQEKTDSS